MIRVAYGRSIIVRSIRYKFEFITEQLEKIDRATTLPRTTLYNNLFNNYFIKTVLANLIIKGEGKFAKSIFTIFTRPVQHHGVLVWWGNLLFKSPLRMKPDSGP